MKVSLKELLSQIPGDPSEQWPEGERYALGFEQGTMSLGFYAPIGADPQRPHKRDEIYIVQSGASRFALEDQILSLSAGDAVFVPAGAAHRFEDFSSDLGHGLSFGIPTAATHLGKLNEMMTAICAAANERLTKRIVHQIPKHIADGPFIWGEVHQ
ncbi:MAG TPA: cupin domain-containing protein [Gammaproteobacteria bacterium]|nr:cupin domain-containing protein [Gammaproteobacteria bacterium]